MLALMLCLAQEISVEGLRGAESYRILAPVEVSSGAHVDGRVVDALGGLPVAGATVETWTEENDALRGGFHRIGEAQSGVDGRFRVRSDAGAEKARVRAPGYLTLSTTLDGLLGVVELFPAPVEPVRLRVVDSEARPIAGARITTTYSCAHDVPAFDVATDATGVALLPAYGLQADVPQLRVRAPGYAAVKYLDAREAIGAGDEPWTLWLPRRSGQTLRVLDPAGEPLAHAPLVVFDAGDHQVLRTDGEGRARLAARYGSGELHVEELTPRVHEPGFTNDPGAETLRLSGTSWPDETPTGRIELTIVGAADEPGGGDPRAHLHHADGWYASTRELQEPLAFPAGDVRLVLGGDFDEYERTLVDLTLAAGETRELTLELVRAPRITLLLPAGTRGAWIEAGGESLVDPKPGEHFVPGGRRLRAFARTDEGIHRVELTQATDGLVLDLSDPATRSVTFPVPAQAAQEIVVAGDGGELVLRSANGAAELVALDAPGRYRVVGPVGTPYFVRWRARGRARTGFRGVLGAGAGTQTIEPVALASLRIESNVAIELRGAEGLDLDALHPGPLRLAVDVAGSGTLGLDLVLAPGEERTLRLTPGE